MSSVSGTVVETVVVVVVVVIVVVVVVVVTSAFCTAANTVYPTQPDDCPLVPRITVSPLLNAFE